jgi:cysteine synthase
MCALGIGQGRITKNLGTFVNHITGALHIPDEKSITMVYDIMDTEGIYIGASSALNVVAAVELAKKLGSGNPATCNCSLCISLIPSIGSTIVTVLCDGAYRYQSRLFSRKWLQSKGLYDVIPEHLQKYAVLE